MDESEAKHLRLSQSRLLCEDKEDVCVCMCFQTLEENKGMDSSLGETFVSVHQRLLLN